MLKDIVLETQEIKNFLGEHAPKRLRRSFCPLPQFYPSISFVFCSVAHVLVSKVEDRTTVVLNVLQLTVVLFETECLNDFGRGVWNLSGEIPQEILKNILLIRKQALCIR